MDDMKHFRDVCFGVRFLHVLAPLTFLQKCTDHIKTYSLGLSLCISVLVCQCQYLFLCFPIAFSTFLYSFAFFLPTKLNVVYFPIVFDRYTAHCLALVSHMTDNQKTIFLRKVLTSDEILHMKIKYVFPVCIY